MSNDAPGSDGRGQTRLAAISEQDPKRSHPRVVERDQCLVLPCSECGKTAVGIVRRQDTPDGEPGRVGVYLSGITRQTFIALDDPAATDRVVAWVKSGDFASLHRFIAHDEGEDGGLDAYCPECDLIYCREHYRVREEWDQGFYDSSHGHCPQGHHRKIDD